MSRKREIGAVEAATMPPMTVTLYHRRKRLVRDLASRGVEVQLLPGCDAQAFTAEVDGSRIGFVLMECGDRPMWSQLALLAHEGVHLALQHLAAIGEDDPGEEELAYAVQAACGCLFDIHLKRLEKRRG